MGRAVELADGRGAPSGSRPRERVRYSGAITAESTFGEWRTAVKMRIYGFHQVKVKVGTQGQDDPRRLKALRRILGRRMDIRLDANEAWPASELLERVEPLAAVPSHGAGAAGAARARSIALAELRPRLGIPVMLDESLCGFPDAEAAVDAPDGRHVQRPALQVRRHPAPRCGSSPWPSVRGWACSSAAIPGETALLSAAGRHVASRVAGLRYVEGSYDRHILAANLTRQDLTFRYGGWAQPLDGPGSGVEVDPGRARGDDRPDPGRSGMTEQRPRPNVRTFAASDGYPLHVAVWPPSRSGAGARSSSLHGVQSHSGWYHNLGRTLAASGYLASFPDRRGSGANQADRGHARRPAG